MGFAWAFFGAAAEAMRRILIQHVRRKRAQKPGCGVRPLALTDADVASTDSPVDLLALSDTIDLLAAEDSTAAALAKLRIFAGLSVDEAGTALGIPHTTAYRQRTYAQAWLQAKLRDCE